MTGVETMDWCPGIGSGSNEDVEGSIDTDELLGVLQ